MATVLSPLLQAVLLQGWKERLLVRSRSAPEGPWVTGGGLEHPCECSLWQERKERLCYEGTRTIFTGPSSDYYNNVHCVRPVHVFFHLI